MPMVQHLVKQNMATDKLPVIIATIIMVHSMSSIMAVLVARIMPSVFVLIIMTVSVMIMDVTIIVCPIVCYIVIPIMMPVVGQRRAGTGHEYNEHQTGLNKLIHLPIPQCSQQFEFNWHKNISLWLLTAKQGIR